MSITVLTQAGWKTSCHLPEPQILGPVKQHVLRPQADREPAGEDSSFKDFQIGVCRTHTFWALKLITTGRIF